MLLKWHVFEDAFGICLRIWSFGGDEMATSTTAAQPHLSNPPFAALGTLAHRAAASVALARGWQNCAAPEVARTNRARYLFQSGLVVSQYHQTFQTKMLPTKSPLRDGSGLAMARDVPWVIIMMLSHGRRGQVDSLTGGFLFRLST